MSQVLHSVVRPDQLDWPKHLPMTEFAINSSVSASMGFVPFELTYGYLLWIIQSVGESSFSGVQDFADDVRDMVICAHDTIIASCVNQTHQANQWQRGDNPLLEVGRKCYDPNIPHDRAGSETPRLAPRARSLSEAAAFPFSRYTADNSDICIHVFRCFITSLISLNIVVTTFPFITCS
jgi:hypothetical protein